MVTCQPAEIIRRLQIVLGVNTQRRDRLHGKWSKQGNWFAEHLLNAQPEEQVWILKLCFAVLAYVGVLILS